jgi:hypothetical protein
MNIVHSKNHEKFEDTKWVITKYQLWTPVYQRDKHSCSSSDNHHVTHGKNPVISNFLWQVMNAKRMWLDYDKQNISWLSVT